MIRCSGICTLSDPVPVALAVLQKHGAVSLVSSNVESGLFVNFTMTLSGDLPFRRLTYEA